MTTDANFNRLAATAPASPAQSAKPELTQLEWDRLIVTAWQHDKTMEDMQRTAEQVYGFRPNKQNSQLLRVPLYGQDPAVTVRQWMSREGMVRLDKVLRAKNYHLHKQPVSDTFLHGLAKANPPIDCLHLYATHTVTDFGQRRNDRLPPAPNRGKVKSTP